MPDYTPVFLPGLAMTFVAAGPITGGDPVEVAGTNTVQKCSVDGSLKYVGVAGHDAAVSARITVFANKVVYDGVADGAIVAGDALAVSSAPGCQVTTVPPISTGGPSDVAAGRAIIGVALTTAANGGIVRWMQR